VTRLIITRAAPLTTIQDGGRFGMLGHGVSASGPMDQVAFAEAGAALESAGSTAIEFTRAGIGFRIEGGKVGAAVAGGSFSLAVNGHRRSWPAALGLGDGDLVEITPGAAGNYGYVRFVAELGVPLVLGSRATNLVAGLGGFQGRALAAGDSLPLIPSESVVGRPVPAPVSSGSFRILWGLHADLFSSPLRQKFLAAAFRVSSRMDRMGVRLEDPSGVFARAEILSLVSDAVVAGDIQILGDGTPIVLMRDHQPTGGYPRLATIMSADLSRFAQLRPGSEVRFTAITPIKAEALFRDVAAP
jgi:biotin-dependent carboxylase-like uncharacterized protein